MNKLDLKAPVVTSKNVLSRKMDIVYIAHNEDGTWEAWADEYVDEEQIQLITLKQLIELDSTINTILDLDQGSAVSRKDKTKNWSITEEEL